MKETSSVPNYDERIILSPIPLSALERMISKAFANEMEKFISIEKPTENADDKLTISEAAAYLKVSKVTIHKYKNNALFPFYQGCGTVYFKKSEIDEALSSKKKGVSKK